MNFSYQIVRDIDSFTKNKDMKPLKDELSIKLIVAGIVINFGIAAIVSILKLPIYFDAVGTILVTLMLGWRAGAIAGTVGFILMTVTGIGPYHIYFIGTQIAIAVFTHFMADKKMFSSFPKVIVTGILMGLIAAIISAPVIVYFFGGVEGNGAGLVTAFLIKTGNTIMESVIYKGLSVEPFDKTIQCLVVFLTVKVLSKKQLNRIDSQLVKKNFLNDQ